jgi:exodeoxyribonuclease-3
MSRSKIVTWNVNGIRASLKKGFWERVDELAPDILCIQETKADESVMAGNVLANSAYTVNWHSCSSRKGYSGVATLSNAPPQSVSTGMGSELFDREGRCLLTKFPEFTLFNVYFPNGGKDNVRVPYKLAVYDRFLEMAESLRRQGEAVIIAGDYNTAHSELDLHDPKSNQNTTGFLPSERGWMDRLLAHGYVDAFRHLHPEAREVYTWWDMRTRARPRNKGWRLDYFFLPRECIRQVEEVTVHDSIHGSDHCPVSLVWRHRGA